MPRGVRFVDLLDDSLRDLEREAFAEDAQRAHVPPRPIVFTPLYHLHTLTLGPGVRRAAFATPARTVTSEAFAATGRATRVRPDTGEPAAPRRRLTTAQRRSLDAFNRLGAEVRDDFSARELRSAFRILARRYHPDRHVNAGEHDRRRLSQQFTTIRASYETLLTALDSPVS